MARKWEKVASMGKKRSALPVFDNNETADTCKRFLMPNKGHFVIYTSDQKRLEIPVLYLGNKIFRELLKISEDEFGLPKDGPIIFPCDEVLIKYIASLLSINASFCSSVCFHQEASSQQLLVYG
ncbi:auxin-responsive protein SAUR68-like [Diospyros lotus]|uniref:auxin-responsive protein SAUR68-like n=1 Tax=Diospyros lotus TaxID=55363 RepID=UPI0022556DF3|nr:auxin-responsive protein SAUR68-like [Diospyros lotus]